MANEILQPGYYRFDGNKTILVEDFSTVPGGNAGGDLGGTYPDPTVNDLTISGEVDGSLLYFDGSNWTALTSGPDGYMLSINSNVPEWISAYIFSDSSAGGDLGGTYPNPEVNDLTISGEVDGSKIYFDGTNWVRIPDGKLNKIIHVSANHTIVSTDNAFYYSIELSGTPGNPITVTLPPSPSEGDRYELKDTVGNAGINVLTIAGNGKNIDGFSNIYVNEASASVILTFVGGLPDQWCVS